MKLRVIAIALSLSAGLFYCRTKKPATTAQGPTEVVNMSEKAWKEPGSEASPVLSPVESLKRMSVEAGFSVALVASEPLVNTPVAMNFDGRGRLWVLEMAGYMPDTLGTGENRPDGKIVILEDSDGDGVMDSRKVFLDSLVLPRAICLIGNGVLVAEPPALWFYEIRDDLPQSRQLVDSSYAVGGNVEHQPNGLLRALDNWIYNAKSRKRYRRVGERWLIENTHFRGQWGLSQDNYGKLYYNHNSANVLGDYFLPAFGSQNPNQKKTEGFNTRIVENNRVYPAHPTPGVNRGYMKGILDDSLRLVKFTAACGPLVYRGDLFDAGYQSNVFVPEPSANLIKRNVLVSNGYITGGAQAYAGREFLASSDERFRPVGLYNAPDGALYVVDMYRGIIQHKTYLTPYLKGQIGKRNLTPPLDYGRIYRIVPQNRAPRPATNGREPAAALVKMLGHRNGWVRDYAQQQLIDRRETGMAEMLRKVTRTGDSSLEVVHALWTLEGLGKLEDRDVLDLWAGSSPTLREQAFGLAPSVINRENYGRFVAVWNRLISEKDTLSFPYIAFAMQYVMPFNAEAALNVLQKLAAAGHDNPYVSGAIVSTLYNRERSFLQTLQHVVTDTASSIYRTLNIALVNAENDQANRNPAMLARIYPKGAELYATVCQTCHGTDGNGVEGLAPPLNNSEWVTGDKDKLLAIVLYGLTGPVEVNNHLYRAPEINADMPGIGYDAEMSNAQIAELLSYIRKSWQNNAESVHQDEVEKMRSKFARRDKAFTVEELDEVLP